MLYSKHTLLSPYHNGIVGQAETGSGMFVDGTGGLVQGSCRYAVAGHCLAWQISYAVMMSKIFEMLAERRIGDAIARGELDDLPGAGQALVFDDEPLLSPEQRTINRILKHAGFTPREVLLRKEIADLRREIESLPAGALREQRRQALLILLLQVSEKGA